MLLHRPNTTPVHALAFSPDGVTLAVAGANRVLMVDWRAGAVTRTLCNRSRPHPPRGIAFDPAGRTLHAGTFWSGTAHFDLADGSRHDHDRYAGDGSAWDNRTATPVAAAPWLAWDARHALSGSRGELTLSLHDLRAGRRVGEWSQEAPRPTDAGRLVRAAWLDPAGRLAVWCSHALLVFEPPPVVPPRPPRTWWQRVGFILSPPLAEPLRLTTWATHPAPVGAQAVAPLPDGETVLLATKGTIHRWHPTGGFTGRWRWPVVQWVRAVAVAPDGLVAVVGDRRGRLLVFDLD